LRFKLLGLSLGIYNYHSTLKIQNLKPLFAR
jgi:hypothetical protein